MTEFKKTAIISKAYNIKQEFKDQGNDPSFEQVFDELCNYFNFTLFEEQEEISVILSTYWGGL